MERLTEHHYVKEHGHYMKCSETCVREIFNCDDCQKFDELVDRLGAYEDTGLTPERCAELAQTDKEGRLVVLPAKLGDTVWFRTYTNNGDVDLGIQPHEVAATRTYVIVRGEFTNVGIPVELFGKTTFLSSKEAEQALKEAKEEG